jgi:hypothetical protein
MGVMFTEKIGHFTAWRIGVNFFFLIWASADTVSRDAEGFLPIEYVGFPDMPQIPMLYAVKLSVCMVGSGL